jgi:hypothetical protein
VGIAKYGGGNAETEKLQLRIGGQCAGIAEAVTFNPAWRAADSLALQIGIFALFRFHQCCDGAVKHFR